MTIPKGTPSNPHEYVHETTYNSQIAFLNRMRKKQRTKEIAEKNTRISNQPISLNRSKQWPVAYSYEEARIMSPSEREVV